MSMRVSAGFYDQRQVARFKRRFLKGMLRRRRLDRKKEEEAATEGGGGGGGGGGKKEEGEEALVTGCQRPVSGRANTVVNE